MPPRQGAKLRWYTISLQKHKKQGGVCAFIDSDRAFDPCFARQCGVQVEQLYFSQPEHAEQAFDIIETLAGSGAFSVVTLDSLNSLVPYHELTSPIGETSRIIRRGSARNRAGTAGAQPAQAFQYAAPIQAAQCFSPASLIDK